MMLEVNVSMASVTVRVDADTKQKAANIAEDLGLDLSSVTRASTSRLSGRGAFL